MLLPSPHLKNTNWNSTHPIIQRLRGWKRGKEREKEIGREKGREKLVSLFSYSHKIFSSSATPGPLFGTFLHLNIFYYYYYLIFVKILKKSMNLCLIYHKRKQTQKREFRKQQDFLIFKITISNLNQSTKNNIYSNVIVIYGMEISEDVGVEHNHLWEMNKWNQNIRSLASFSAQKDLFLSLFPSRSLFPPLSREIIISSWWTVSFIHYSTKRLLLV